MDLEKVTSRSGQAALAGWISSNDVTLFTTVLVVAVAMFLHVQLTKRAEENLQHVKRASTVARELEATADKLSASNDILEQTRNSLRLTQVERSQLSQKLSDKLAAVAQLQSKLDALIKDTGQLESRHQSLKNAKQSADEKMAALMTQQTLIVADRDSLKTDNEELRKQLALTKDQLTNKISALDQFEGERERLIMQVKELDTLVSRLKQRLERQQIELAEARNQAASVQSETAKKIEGLETKLAESHTTIEEYLGKLTRATDRLQSLQAEANHLQRVLNEDELKHQAELIAEGRNHRELLGLPGPLDRVAVLFDASGSMRQATIRGGSDRWAEAQEIAAKWLKHLSVKQCVLIVFSSEVRTFPEDGSLADLHGTEGQAKRDALLQHVKTVSPSGWTNTYDALRKAYQYDVDAILLFSDGAPSLPNSGDFNSKAATKIYALCREHPKIPVHTIGLGDYFDENASTFLMSVARISNGSFRGQ